jgi:hypothetical protein
MRPSLNAPNVVIAVGFILTVLMLIFGSGSQSAAPSGNDPRPNDLSELCKDQVFYRDKAARAAAEGDEKGRASAFARFQQVSRWIHEYSDEDIARVCTS